MGKIQLLDQNTINKIAAGEVVERPAAVAKELIENAIDAGANAITCEIKEGGISFIRITDNGCGIEKSEIDTAFLRHATSKIQSVEDLLSISSLGFRGEALASIASVAQVELVTKTPSEMTGTRYVIEGGEKKTCEDIGSPSGTTFIVRNLFYNTPARRKFLKSAQSEAGYINDLMMRLAVSHPDVSFKFIVNNQIKLHTTGNNNLKDVLYSIYGRDITASLLEVNSVYGNIKIYGYIGKPIIARGNRTYENYFINGRYIKSGIICKAIEDAYKPFMMEHKYPFTALHYTIESEFIDVNVHPTKLEIRFRNSDVIFQATENAIREALSTKEMIPEISFDDTRNQKNVNYVKEAPEPFEFNRIRKGMSPTHTYDQRDNSVKGIDQSKILAEIVSDRKTDETSKEPSIFEQLRKKREELWAKEKVSDHMPSLNLKLNVQTSNSSKPVNEIQTVNEETSDVTQTINNISGQQPEPFLSEQAKKRHRIIGQLFATYWIIEYDDKMFIIDQHAAHEKVLYEKTMKHVHEKTPYSQMIEPPIVIAFSMREEEVFLKHKSVFEKLGYEIEHFGGKEYSIRAVPSDMLNIEFDQLFVEILDQLVESNYEKDATLVLEKVASMSCKAAIKGNQKISYQEASDLIDQLLELENPYNCPHGRPVIISMSKYELEKKFKRIL